MNEIKITVLFEPPFYIGLFERFDDKKFYIAKFTFGKEPTNPEIYEFTKKNFKHLKFIKVDLKLRKSTFKLMNPKRRQRVATKELKTSCFIKKAKDAYKESLKHKKN